MATAIETLTVWTPDLPVEQMLDKLDVQWSRQEVPIGLIDQQASLKNQARIGVTLDSDVVDNYATAMKNGSNFPALVGFMQSNGSYVLAGGNHRLAAARIVGFTQVGLYVCDVRDQAIRRLITTSLNTIVGLSPSREDTLLQAVHWMKTYGRTVAATAAAYNISRDALDNYLKHTGARERLQSLGVSPDNIARQALQRLSRVQNDNLFVAAANFIQTYKVTEPELREMLSEANQKRTEADQLEVVARWSQRDDIKARRNRHARKVHQTPYARVRSEIFRSLRSAESALARGTTRAALGLTNDEEFATATRLAQDILTKLTSIQ